MVLALPVKPQPEEAADAGAQVVPFQVNTCPVVEPGTILRGCKAVPFPLMELETPLVAKESFTATWLPQLSPVAPRAETFTQIGAPEPVDCNTCPDAPAVVYAEPVPVP